MITKMAMRKQDLPNATPKPKVGMVMSFTGYYHSVKLIARFLELAGVQVVKSRISTPKIIEAGTTFASADFCIPLRVYVGHVYHLVQEHRDLDAIVAPNVLSEDGLSSTCSKYRDVGGVAIRSLGDTIGYLLNQARGEAGDRLENLVGPDAVSERRGKAAHLPPFIMPNVESLGRQEMWITCYNVYADLMGWPKSKKSSFFLPEGLRERLAPQVTRLQTAFGKAYAEVVENQKFRLDALMADETKPRIALVGRKYLIHDPALTCDLKTWFQKKGAAVLTASDVPYELLRGAYEKVDGYYDTHREGEAFIDWALDKVDGFISLGSFGCHPDAFQIDFLAEYARAKKAPAWTFRYDESAGSAGFHTRYETIHAFLEQRREQRLARVRGEGAPVVSQAPGRAFGAPPAVPLELLEQPGRGVAKKVSGQPGHFSAEDQRPAVTHADTAAAKPKKPLIVWPYMGEILNLLVEEICWQIGLAEYLRPPAPLAEAALELGNNHYTESCSPYACSTGTLKQSLTDALRELEEEAARQVRPVEPRRILMLMARGEGPCTFGWYAIVQNKHIPEEFRDDVERHGHTLEMTTMGLDGVVDFIRDLCEIGGRERLKPVLAYLEAAEKGMEKLPWPVRTRLQFGLARLIREITRPAWAKLDAAEALRAKSLIVRAHELEPGVTTAAYKEALEGLRGVHTPLEIRRAYREGLARLAAVPQDHKTKPRVVSVGEIYIALVSFGNRGTIENIMAREGIEVVEGISLGGFLRHSIKEMKRRARRNHPLLRPILDYLKERNVALMEQQVRTPEAKPFIAQEVGGDGLPTVGHARQLVEEGCDGIVHTYPFKCMPEGLAKDALKELADLYGVRYLPLSFDKETEIERLKTEVSTFAALLHAEVAQRGGNDPAAFRENKRREIARRRALGRTLDNLYAGYRQHKHVD